MFSKQFRQSLATGKYTQWAVDLPQPSLQALLWAIGEYGLRADVILELLERHKDELSVHDERFARARLALEVIARFVTGERPSLDDVCSRVRKVLAEARAVAEEEWPSYREHSWKMLERLPNPASKRKCRLLCVALCRRVWHLFPDDCFRRAVEVAERYADGLAGEDELAAVRAAAETAHARSQAPGQPGGGAACVTAALDPDPDGVAYAAAISAGLAAAGTAVEPDQSDHALWRVYYEGKCQESAAQCDLIRDVFGNPFHPVSIAPEWLTTTAVALARGIYADRGFDRLPVLADALEEAGCDNTDILGHCRGKGPHVPGCWIVDLLSGRS